MDQSQLKAYQPNSSLPPPTNAWRSVAVWLVWSMWVVGALGFGFWVKRVTEEAAGNVGPMQRALAAAQVRNTELQGALQTDDDKIEAATHKLDKLEQSLATADARIYELQQTVRSENEMMRTAKQEADALRQKLQAATVELNKLKPLQQALVDSQARISELQSENARIVENQRSSSRGWLGVGIKDMDWNSAYALGLGEIKGAFVAQVEASSPAQAAGLRMGDVILAVDSESIDTGADLPRKIAAMRPGTFVNLTIYRSRVEQTTWVTLGARPNNIALSNTASKLKTFRVTSDFPDGKLSLRDGPGKDHTKLAEIPVGAILRQLAPCEGSDDAVTKFPWCKIEWNGTTGWVSSSGLHVMDGSNP